MKKISLENVLNALENLEFEIDLPEEIIKNAYSAVKKMLEIV